MGRLKALAEDVALVIVYYKAVEIAIQMLNLCFNHYHESIDRSDQ